jgi:hypothetical protein
MPCRKIGTNLDIGRRPDLRRLNPRRSYVAQGSSVCTYLRAQQVSLTEPVSLLSKRLLRGQLYTILCVLHVCSHPLPARAVCCQASLALALCGRSAGPSTPTVAARHVAERGLSRFCPGRWQGGCARYPVPLWRSGRVVPVDAHSPRYQWIRSDPPARGEQVVSSKPKGSRVAAAAAAGIAETPGLGAPSRNLSSCGAGRQPQPGTVSSEVRQAKGIGGILERMDKTRATKRYGAGKRSRNGGLLFCGRRWTFLGCGGAANRIEQKPSSRGPHRSDPGKELLSER